MKLIKLLKQIKEIRSLNEKDFHVIKFDKDTDLSSMCDFSDYLDSKNIKHVILCDNAEIKSLGAADKEDLLEYIKKEVGLEEPETVNNIGAYKDGTLNIKLSTMSDIKMQYNDLIIEYDEVTNVVLISYDLKDGKHNKYVLPVKEKGNPVYFKYKSDFGYFGGNEIFDMENI